jgi:hypothetical protein
MQASLMFGDGVSTGSFRMSNVKKQLTPVLGHGVMHDQQVLATCMCDSTFATISDPPPCATTTSLLATRFAHAETLLAVELQQHQYRMNSFCQCLRRSMWMNQVCLCVGQHVREAQVAHLVEHDVFKDACLKARTVPEQVE